MISRKGFILKNHLQRLVLFCAVENNARFILPGQLRHKPLYKVHYISMLA